MEFQKIKCLSTTKSNITGPSLPPYHFSGFLVQTVAESPDGRGVLLFGGVDTEYEGIIFELNIGANFWKTLDISLQCGRILHVVIPLQ